MPPKIIKLGKKDDIASVVKLIKDMKDLEVVFELEAGSMMLRSSDNLKLMKRTGEALGKKIKVTTSDEIGLILAKKAGVLYGDAMIKMPKGAIRVARSDVKPRFSDILANPHRMAKQVAEKAKVFSAPTIKSGSIVSKLPNFPKFNWRFPVIFLASFSSASPDASLGGRERSGNGRGSNFNKFFIGSIAVVILIVLGLAIFLPQATITIYARDENVTRDFEIIVDKAVATADSNNLEIPGVPIDKSESLTKNFPATGTSAVGTKATGSVILYNFTKNTLTLKVATTTLVANGKKYSFAHDVTGIRPTGGTEAAPDKSTLTIAVPIISQLPGDSYNLPIDTKFQIVNAALGNKNVYALSSSAISGGAATTSTIISQADLDQAAETMTGQIVTQVASEVGTEVGGTIVLLDSGVTKQVLAKTANKNVNDPIDNFDMTIIAKVTGLGFKEGDLLSVVIDKIKQVLSSDKYLVTDAKNQYTATFKTIDMANSKGVLAVHFSTTAAYSVDTRGLSKLLAGKNEQEIQEILLSKPEVDKVKVGFWPKWMVHKAPILNGKIYIKSVLAQGN